MLSRQTLELSSAVGPAAAGKGGRSPADQWLEIAALSALSLLAVLPYLNTLHNGFVYDDVTQILVNPYIRNFHHLREIMTTSVWSYYGGNKGITNYYRPVMLLEYLLCFRLSGPRATLFHAVNVFAHAAVVIVMFKTTERMFKKRALAFAAAALFALHPIHTEPVAWIAAVPDLQVSLFYFLTFWIFLGLARPDRGRLLLWQFGMGTAFFLALLSKEVSVTLPLLATAYEHLYREDRQRTHWKQKVSRYGLLWALNVFYMLFRIQMLGAFGLVHPTRDMAYPEVFISAFALIGQYLWKFMWPISLCAYYVFHEDLATRLPSIAWGMGAIFFLMALFLILWKRARPISFGLLWFLATLAPVLNPRWMPANVFSERYLYLPSAGLCWVAMWAFTSLSEITADRAKAWRWGLVTAMATLSALCVTRIVTRNRDWHDDETLYTRTLALSPDSSDIHNNLGYVYYGQGDLKRAEREWLQAQDIAPLNRIASDNLCLVYLDEGRYDEAVGNLLQSIRIQPDDTDAHVNLGMTYAKMGRVQSAEAEFLAAITLSPLNLRAHNQLGNLYYEEARYADAAEQLNLSIQSVPTTDAYLHLGMAYEQLGKLDQAEFTFKKAAGLYPWDSRFHFALGILHEVRGRAAEANREYEAAFKLEPNNPEVRAALQKFKGSLAKAKPQ